jgi:signal transduction histidine kinase
MKHFCGILLLIILTFSLKAKETSMQVYATFRDSRGLIWFGTETGLNLYQGKKLISYNFSSKDSNSIIGGIVYSIAEDEKKNLWIVTYTNGITIFNPEKNLYRKLTPISHPILFANKYSITLKYIGNETMLLNTSQGSYFINTKDYSYKVVLPKKFQSYEVLIHQAYQNKNYYLINKIGLLEISNNGNSKLYSLPASDMNFMGLSIINNNLYVSGFSGIHVLNIGRLIQIPTFYKNKEISKEGINDMLEDEDQNVYLNSIKYGMLKVKIVNEHFECTSFKNENWYGDGNTLYSNYYDTINHSFFVGTQKGLRILKQHQHYFKELIDHKYEIGTIRSLLHYKNQLYVGTEQGGYILNGILSKLSESGLSKKALINNLFLSKINKLYGAGFDFYQIDNNLLSKNKFVEELISNSENAILAGNLNDSIIYIITNSNNNIIYWNIYTNKINTDIIPNVGYLIPPTLVYRSNILLATYTGLFLYDIKLKVVKRISSKNDSQITDCKVLNNSIYYSTSTDGIVILDSNFSEQKRIDISSLAGSNDVRSILIHKNNIWFSSMEGIGYYELRNNSLHYFKSGELFTTSSFMNGSSTQHQDTLYFGGDNGIVAVNTIGIENLQINTKVYLVDVSLYRDGELMKVSNPLGHEFLYDQNNIEIQLVHTISDFSVFNQYDYILNDNSIIPIDESGKLKLYNLYPDNYQLKVIERATKKPVAYYNFKILPPWYQTWWFRILLGIIVLANGIWITQLYYKRKLIAQQKELEKQQALQSERDRISNDMHDDLGSGLSSIKLISEMLKRKHDDVETKNDLNEIVENATNLTDTMRELVWSLNPRNDDLERFVDHLEEYAKRFFEPSQIKFVFHKQSEISNESMNGFIRRNLFLCLKEVFNNCIKHSQASQVALNISYVNSKLTIQIQDNGIGLAQQNSHGSGFYTMQKRIQNCNGILEFNSTQEGLSTLVIIPI